MGRPPSLCCILSLLLPQHYLVVWFRGHFWWWCVHLTQVRQAHYSGVTYILALYCSCRHWAANNSLLVCFGPCVAGIPHLGTMTVFPAINKLWDVIPTSYHPLSSPPSLSFSIHQFCGWFCYLTLFCVRSTCKHAVLSFLTLSQA